MDQILKINDRPFWGQFDRYFAGVIPSKCQKDWDGDRVDPSERALKWDDMKVGSKKKS